MCDCCHHYIGICGFSSDELDVDVLMIGCFVRQVLNDFPHIVAGLIKTAFVIVVF